MISNSRGWSLSIRRPRVQTDGNIPEQLTSCVHGAHRDTPVGFADARCAKGGGPDSAQSVRG
jgi:hypothetical protein